MLLATFNLLIQMLMFPSDDASYISFREKKKKGKIISTTVFLADHALSCTLALEGERF